jgi:hypothetical protein
MVLEDKDIVKESADMGTEGGETVKEFMDTRAAFMDMRVERSDIVKELADMGVERKDIVKDFIDMRVELREMRAAAA